MEKRTIWVEKTGRKLMSDLNIKPVSFFYNLLDKEGRVVDGYDIPSNTDTPFLVELLKEYEVLHYFQ